LLSLLVNLASEPPRQLSARAEPYAFALSRPGELTAHGIDSLGSGRFLERYDDIGQYPLVWCETRFACIRPPREPHDASRRSPLGVRLSRFDDVESILVKKERVVAETLAEIFNYRMIVGNRLSVELSQGSFDVLRRQFHPVLLSIASLCQRASIA
jgi:hypothetical protein